MTTKYRTTFDISDTTNVTYTLLFDGAMSNAKVCINGRHAITWPYGYNSFYVGIDSLVRLGHNDLVVTETTPVHGHNILSHL